MEEGMSRREVSALTFCSQSCSSAQCISALTVRMSAFSWFVLVGVWLLQEARDVRGHGRVDHVLQPGSERDALGPLGGQAVGEDEALAVLLLDEVDGPARDELVCPGPRLAPDVDGLEDSVAALLGELLRELGSQVLVAVVA